MLTLTQPIWSILCKSVFELIRLFKKSKYIIGYTHMGASGKNRPLTPALRPGGKPIYRPFSGGVRGGFGERPHFSRIIFFETLPLSQSMHFNI